jgi:GNAT superfamily N-acetyltransferase
MAFTISTDKSRLDVAAVHDFLCNEAYWSQGRPREVVERSIAGSMCFGVYDSKGRQVGFARVVTDQATFAWIADLFILREARGRGLSKALVRAIIEHPDLQNMRRWLLGTRDAHGLYAQFGFEPLPEPKLYMVRSGGG